MRLVNYKDLEIYKIAHQMTLEFYALVEHLPERESKNLCSQTVRAAASLPLNIAEGSGSISYKVFLNHLVYAYRSALELEAILFLIRDLKYLSAEELTPLFDQLTIFIRKLTNYMNYIEMKKIKTDDTPSSFYWQSRKILERNEAKRI